MNRTVYVSAYHPEDPEKKEYLFKAPGGMPFWEPGQLLTVDTRRGPCSAISIGLFEIAKDNKPLKRC